MPDYPAHLSTASIVGEVQRLLKEGGYHVDRSCHGVEFPQGRSLLAEDQYGIVAVIVYETWRELISDWPNAQGQLVDLLSKKLSRADPKIWEGYLLLVHPLALDEEAQREAEDIRHDVSRIRKFVITGNNLEGLKDIERALLPLLPLNTHALNVGTEELIDLLPALLSRHGIEERTARVIVDAFKKQEPILEKLYKLQEGQ